MRTIATILLALIFAPALWTALATHSLLSYAGDPTAVTGSARDSDLHGLAVSAGETIVVEELHQTGVANAELETLVRRETRAVVGRALDPEWLYSSFAALYGDALAIALERPAANGDSSPPTALTTIEFGERKKQLGDGLGAIADTIEEECGRIFGEAPCRDPDARRAAKKAHRAAVSRALSSLPDRFSLADLLARAGRDWLDPDSRQRRDARRAVGTMNIARLVAAGLCVVCLLLIAVVNLSSLSRLLRALGAVLVVSAAIYLAANQVADAQVEKLIIESSLEEQAAVTPRDDPVGELARQAGETVTIAIARDGLHHGDSIALAIAAIGACALLGGLLGRDRR